MRVFSFANESTRYCNYSKDRFHGEITCVKPSWLPDVRDGERELGHLIEAWKTAENLYFQLLQDGCSPQQARDVLPIGTKSELVMTGFESDWLHFLNLRYYGYTGKPHPDINILAGRVKDFIENQ